MAGDIAVARGTQFLRPGQIPRRISYSAKCLYGIVRTVPMCRTQDSGAFVPIFRIDIQGIVVEEMTRD